MIFEDLLMEIQSDLVSLGLEYSNSQIDEIYLYGYMEEGSYFFNLFFYVHLYLRQGTGIILK